jgi:hypothetical protein
MYTRREKGERSRNRKITTIKENLTDNILNNHRRRNPYLRLQWMKDLSVDKLISSSDMKEIFSFS